jgi:hypothetical protein
LQNINAVSLVLLALAILLPGCANALPQKQGIARPHLGRGYLTEHGYAFNLKRENSTLSVPPAFHLDNKSD